MRSLGVVFEPAFPPERLREVALSVEDAGVPQLWLWEDCFRESGIAEAAAALAATTELTVAIGVLPMPLRNVALTAMEPSEKQVHKTSTGPIFFLLTVCMNNLLC